MNLVKPELGCLKRFEREVNFKPEARPVFCKPRPVSLAILENLNDSYEEGIRRGVWQHTDFNTYGTPVVPVRKVVCPGQGKSRIRVCGDYSVTVNAQLETHRQPMPLPGDLMRNLQGGYCFTKVDWPMPTTKSTWLQKTRRYRQIHTEALAINFALNWFHLFHYDRHFILVMDHKLLLALFGPSKETPLLAAIAWQDGH